MHRTRERVPVLLFYKSLRCVEARILFRPSLPRTSSFLISAEVLTNDTSPEDTLLRRYAVIEIADMVLLNVAAHAADALSEPPVIRRTRRFLRFWRKPRRSDPEELHQRRLFAV